jgi:acyl-CoA synthetase (AMP-forming)/AMP-acid ligase II
MIEAEPWSYHVDGSPVYSLADIIAEAVRHYPGGDRVHRGGPDGLVRRVPGPGDHVPAEEFAHRLRSAGRPMRGARVRVVYPVTLKDCPAGRRGEVLVAGSRIMKGSWRKPGQTAEVLLPGGWLRTGDGGSFDADGYLYLHDRLTDMIVTGGENVYPAEVESVLIGHPAVAEVAVVGVPSARWGESPYAVVVVRPGAQVSEAELIAWTRDRLAHFKCPAGVSFAASWPARPPASCRNRPSAPA